MKELWSLARDASVAVGAYVGMVRDRFWAELSNGDGFDERLARARAEFAADRLAEKEAAEAVSEPSLQKRQPYSPFVRVRYHNSPACSSGHCVCGVAREPSAPSVDAYMDTPARSSAAEQETSGGSPRYYSGYELIHPGSANPHKVCNMCDTPIPNTDYNYCEEHRSTDGNDHSSCRIDMQTGECHTPHCIRCGRMLHGGGLVPCECESSSGQSAQGAVEEPRVATGPPLGTPGRVDSEAPPVSPSPSGPSLLERAGQNFIDIATKEIARMDFTHGWSPGPALVLIADVMRQFANIVDPPKKAQQ